MTHVYDCDHRFEGLTFEGVKRLIGGKAANLAVMAVDLGLPVPPAFTITTAACNEYLARGWPAGLDDELADHMHQIERLVGRGFGDPANPLLVSVRSGAPVSMPGMMDTILNLGLTPATTAGLAAVSGSEKFAANCRSRFTSMFRDIVGVDAVPDDPWVQLRLAVEAVFRSWNGDRARTYREREGIPADFGTAVTIQAMVFGNRSVDSGTGVIFTRSPSTGEPELYGDVMFNAQGEDVVAGTHRTEPIGVLDTRMPAVGRELREYAARLERHHRDMCDIEFTIEHGKLWLLQCRIGKRSPQAALRIALDMAEDPDFPLSRADAVRRVADLLADPPMRRLAARDVGPPIATGLPASPGVACGEIATTPDAAVEAAEAGRPVILVRAETSPDDVHGMSRAIGILTATGGLASHAAVVARGWGIPAVVGAGGVEVGQGWVVIGGRTLAVGELITIDGATGEVFAGAVAGAATVVPEASTLLAWARDLGIEVGRGGSPEVGPAPAAAQPSGVMTDDVLRSLAVRGYTTPLGAAGALLADPDETSGLLDRLVADGLAEAAAGSFRLTAEGQAAARRLLAADTEQWGTDNASAALDAFLALDGRVKQIVTAWQMREIAGVPAINDHTDAAYDARVLDDLAAVHADA
ncbi:MAG TPA: pyruvate, phosphate dikinase, partial [Candidatus Sulfomarinibacteraceae bacterium]|nr:pyruvate, phosphate dikinase [Candidatus Sulfomarinibacteraceae bacterium]